MVGEVVRAQGDLSRLGKYLQVLAVPNRLDLLRKLQVPKTVNEIRLTSSRRRKDGSPDRPISRQAIQQHLAALGNLGLVEVRGAEREGRTVSEYVVSHARLFVIVDELARIGAIRPVRGGHSQTVGPMTMRAGADVGLPTGPGLVAANGPLSGTFFRFEGAGPWIVGRASSAHVSLPYDPFISRENTRIVRRGDGFRIEALAAASNGTRLNWRALPAGESAPVVAGDALGVGRSLLFARGL